MYQLKFTMQTKEKNITLRRKAQSGLQIDKPDLKLQQRECPRCEGMVEENEKEECFECSKCGYIDCGDDY